MLFDTNPDVAFEERITAQTDILKRRIDMYELEERTLEARPDKFFEMIELNLQIFGCYNILKPFCLVYEKTVQYRVYTCQVNCFR